MMFGIFVCTALFIATNSLTQIAYAAPAAAVPFEVNLQKQNTGIDNDLTEAASKGENLIPPPPLMNFNNPSKDNANVDIQKKPQNQVVNPKPANGVQIEQVPEGTPVNGGAIQPSTIDCDPFGFMDDSIMRLMMERLKRQQEHMNSLGFLFPDLLNQFFIPTTNQIMASIPKMDMNNMKLVSEKDISKGKLKGKLQVFESTDPNVKGSMKKESLYSPDGQLVSSSVVTTIGTNESPLASDTNSIGFPARNIWPGFFNLPTVPRMKLFV